MRKAEIQTLFDYMYWVNHQLLEATARLRPDGLRDAAGVTTRDLLATLVHELDVEWSWRLNLEGRAGEAGEDAELRAEDYPDVEALREHWSRDEAEMRSWLDGLTDEDLRGEVASEFSDDRRPLWQYLIHIVTHAAQQQADAATLLTLAGRSPGELGFLEYLSTREP
jgi:uncharacterized damage-inducible protein DinB